MSNPSKLLFTEKKKLAVFFNVKAYASPVCLHGNESRMFEMFFFHMGVQ